MGELKLFQGDCDWFIAKDFEDLKLVCEEYYGDSEVFDQEENWRELKPDQDFPITFDDDFIIKINELPIPCHLERTEIGLKVTAKISDWIQCRGHGFLASTEY